MFALRAGKGAEPAKPSFECWLQVYPRHQEVPLSSLFSILLGTAVFLRSEGAMRKTVSKVLHAALHSVESEIVDLVARSGELNEAEWKRVSELRSLHKDLTASGSYRTVLASGLSLLVPLIGPMAAVLKVMSGR